MPHEEIFENVQAAQKAAFQASQHPGFPVVIALMQGIAQGYYAPLPRKPEDKIGYETFCVVRTAIEEAIRSIGDYVTEGERLTQIENGDIPNEQKTGHNGPGRRSRT